MTNGGRKLGFIIHAAEKISLDPEGVSLLHGRHIEKAAKKTATAAAIAATAAIVIESKV